MATRASDPLAVRGNGVGAGPHAAARVEGERPGEPCCARVGPKEHHNLGRRQREPRSVLDVLDANALEHTPFADQLAYLRVQLHIDTRSRRIRSVLARVDSEQNIFLQLGPIIGAVLLVPRPRWGLPGE